MQNGSVGGRCGPEEGALRSSRCQDLPAQLAQRRTPRVAYFFRIRAILGFLKLYIYIYMYLFFMYMFFLKEFLYLSIIIIIVIIVILLFCSFLWGGPFKQIVVYGPTKRCSSL